MANKCGICGADINLMQTQKLADGNCICRKNCRSRGFKVYDYVHGNLSGVKAHLDQVERGTKLWEHYFVPRLKTKDKNQKLTRFGAHLYVAEDIGLVAFTQVDYKILIFGKTTRACVYRIADLRNYMWETISIPTMTRGTRIRRATGIGVPTRTARIRRTARRIWRPTPSCGR